MSEKGFLYSLRRRAQVNAQKIFSYETMSKFYYYVIFRRKLNLKDPKYFNEKIQWLKLFYYPNRDDVIQGADKYAVRNYLEDRGLGEYLNNLIGVWNSWDEVDWEKLPEKFALKTNHGARYNIICSDKSKLSEKETGNTITKWLSEDFSLYNAEVHYSKIERKIICEEYLEGDITDYKFFCFHGEPKFFYVARGFGEGQDERMAFFNIDGTKADFKRTQYNVLEEDIIIPENLSEMINISKILSKDFPFVRIDLFNLNGKIMFSEMTFTPGGGLMTIEPEDYYRIWGDYLTLPKIN